MCACSHINDIMQLDTKINTDELEAGLDFLALIIDRHGDRFWPLFETLESELQECKDRKSKIRSRIS